LRKGDSLVWPGLASFETKLFAQVIADLWERYMALLDSGVGDGCVALRATPPEHIAYRLRTGMLWISLAAKDTAAGGC
jgi:hypothetical protein